MGKDILDKVMDRIISSGLLISLELLKEFDVNGGGPEEVSEKGMPKGVFLIAGATAIDIIEQVKKDIKKGENNVSKG